MPQNLISGKKNPCQGQFIYIHERQIPVLFFFCCFSGRTVLCEIVYTAMSSGNMKTCTRLFLFMVHVQLLVNPVHCLLEENEIKNSNDPLVSRKYLITFYLYIRVLLRCNRTPQYCDELPNKIKNKIQYNLHVTCSLALRVRTFACLRICKS